MRYRLYPTSDQIPALLEHCAHARYVWNIAVEQLGYQRPGRWMPNAAEQFRQLTEARAVTPWLAAGSAVVQQQALRDFHQACTRWQARSQRRPTWRKQGRSQGFRVVFGHGIIAVRNINKRWAEVHIPKVGSVRLRKSRAVAEARSYRVTRDGMGRWHIAFAAPPAAIVKPGNHIVIGVDRGVVVTLACSDGTMLHGPRATDLRAADRAVSRAMRGSRRRALLRRQRARAHARDTDRRRDFIEKATTDLARRADVIRIEDLRVGNMTRSARGSVLMPGRNVKAKSGLNRVILASGWGKFARRLEDKAPGRVEKVNPAYTSQRCSRCTCVDLNSRKSQALFECTACGYRCNADVNAARNIAAGQAVRRAGPSRPAVKRRPEIAV